jgi:hypothetical protein
VEYTVVPLPADTQLSEDTFHAPWLGAFVASWAYHDAAGDLVAVVPGGP